MTLRGGQVHHFSPGPQQESQSCPVDGAVTPAGSLQNWRGEPVLISVPKLQLAIPRHMGAAQDQDKQVGRKEDANVQGGSQYRPQSTSWQLPPLY